MPLKSFIAYTPETHFPLENIPFGVFTVDQNAPRVGTRIGETVIDLSVLAANGHFADCVGFSASVFSAVTTVPTTPVTEGRAEWVYGVGTSNVACGSRKDPTAV
jgi:hypothetical protein